MLMRRDMPIVVTAVSVSLILIGEFLPAFVRGGTPDERLAEYTFWLMAFTGLLVAVSTIQILFVIQADRTARVAAEAARKSADAAVAVALPVVYLKQMFLLARDPEYQDSQKYVFAAVPPTTCLAHLEFVNYGHTPARLIEFFAEHRICEALPVEPAYTVGTTFPIGEVIEADGADLQIKTPANFELADKERSSIADGSAYLWVYGYLSFRDFLGAMHETRFCLRWWGVDPEAGSDQPPGFYQDGPDAYWRST